MIFFIGFFIFTEFYQLNLVKIFVESKVLVFNANNRLSLKRAFIKVLRQFLSLKLVQIASFYFLIKLFIF